MEPAVPVFAADVQRIDKSNWQNVKGLIPESALKWVQTGEMVLQYGNLEYNPAQVLPKWVLESKKQNIGKYKLTSKSAIVDAATGKTPSFIKGIPFPDVKINDPQGPEKVMWNCLYMRDSNGPLNDKIDFKFFGRRTGYERSIMVDWLSKPYDGYAPAEDQSNPDNYEAVNSVIITSPFDMAGTAMMTWRYRTEKDDMLYGYVPAIRRVRRLTPAGRSDSMFGSDFARDDGSYGTYDGSIKDFKWKFLGEGQVIGAFIGTKPMTVTENKNGEWVFPLKNNKSLLKWSYNHKGGSAAPWFVDNAVWTKRPVWIIEGIPKDKYYNYGRQIIYVDKETNIGYWKVIYDRTGKYWKTLWTYWLNGQDAGKTTSWNAILMTNILDERAKHATSVDSSIQYVCGAKLNSNMFSLAGFTALCK
jgi:hypothetical protein